MKTIAVLVVIMLAGVWFNVKLAEKQCIEDAKPFDAKLTILKRCQVSYNGNWIDIKYLFNKGVLIK